jgi:hypothetical protein
MSRPSESIFGIIPFQSQQLSTNAKLCFYKAFIQSVKVYARRVRLELDRIREQVEYKTSTTDSKLRQWANL